MTVRRVGHALGGEIVGLDLCRPMDEAEFAAVHRAFLDHAVLVFRDQRLSPQAHVEFSKRFGPLDVHIVEGFRLPDHPEVFVVSNVKEDGKLKGAIYAGQVVWRRGVEIGCRLSKAPTPGKARAARRMASRNYAL